MLFDREKLGSTGETYRRIALAVTHPGHPDAYMTSCHSITAYALREQPDQIPDDAKIVLLGFGGNLNRVAHSIIVGADDEILSDSMLQGGTSRVAFETATGKYENEAYAHSDLVRNYEVLADMSVGDFRELYIDVLNKMTYEP